MKRFLAIIVVIATLPVLAMATDEMIEFPENFTVRSETTTVIEKESTEIPKLSASRATSGYCGNNLTWNFSTTTGTLCISGIGPMYDFQSKVTSKLPGDIPWEYYRSNIKTVVIESGVTSIGAFAFYNCEYMENAFIPDTIASINAHAFHECSNLKNITLPQNLNYIGRDAFIRCNSLTSIIVPGGVSTICESAFYECGKLECVILCSGISEIEEKAFDRCSRLITVVLPETLSFIGDYAFLGCSRLSEVYYQGTTSQWNSLLLGNHPELKKVTAIYIKDGDINGDKKVNITDLACLYTYLSTGENDSAFTNTILFSVFADTNGDGDINILDYQALYEMIKKPT